MRFLLLLLSVLLGFQVNAQRNCAAHDMHQEMMLADPDYARKHQEIENYTQQYLRSVKPDMMRTGEVIIPVVFHIIYRTPAQNLSEQRILEQVETFNQDYNARNADTSLIPDAFKSLKGAFNVKFVLANRDPDGNVTTGIVRRETTRNSFNASSITTPTAQPMKFTNQGGSNAWDTRFYLNVWVCNLSGGVLGYATFPASAGTAYDGIVLASAYTGSTGAGAPFNLGRTGTHEVGHYFNLRHIWGDETNCSGSDNVDDTPNQRSSTGGCPTFPRTDNCSPNAPGIMFMNYMDYTNDACMYMFTNGQVGRMQAALDGPRATLLNSPGFVDDQLNDIRASAASTPTSITCQNTFTPAAVFINDGVNDITSFTANFSIDGGVVVSKQWTGVLAPDSIVTVTFDEPLSLGNGIYTITYFSTAPNDTTDDDVSNDSVSLTFNISTVSTPVITGDFSLCIGDSTVLSATEGDFTYLWSTNETTGSISVKPQETTIYTVTLTNGNGCSAQTEVTVVVNDNPEVPVITGDLSICNGDSTVLSATDGDFAYLWSTGATTGSIAVSPEVETNYSVLITSAEGCSSASTEVTVIVTETPATPEIGSNSPVQVGNAINLTTATVEGATYSWTGPGGYVSEEQNPVILNATTANGGTYTLTLTVNGCKSEAVNVDVIVNEPTAVQINGINSLVIAPNPYRNFTTLSFDLLDAKRCVITVTDISGKELERQILEAAQGRNVIEIGRNLSAGSYFLSVDTGNDRQTYKLSVQ